MKNMKKILAVGALLTLGTMAMGEAANEAEFKILLDVVEPIGIVADTGIIDFGNIAKTDFRSVVAHDGFTVSGTKNVGIKFTHISTGNLTNTEGDSIPFKLEVKDDTTNEIGDTGHTLDTSGTFDGSLIVTLDPNDTLGSNVVAGNYKTDVTLEVNYN